MVFLRSLRRWLGAEAIDVEVGPESESEAARIAYDRDSIRVSQQVAARGAGGPMAPTPEVLHPRDDNR